MSQVVATTWAWRTISPRIVRAFLDQPAHEFGVPLLQALYLPSYMGGLYFQLRQPGQRPGQVLLLSPGRRVEIGCGRLRLALRVLDLPFDGPALLVGLLLGIPGVPELFFRRAESDAQPGRRVMGDGLSGAKMRLYLHIHLPGERGKQPLGLPSAGPRRVEPAVHVGRLVGQPPEFAAPGQAPDSPAPGPTFAFDALAVEILKPVKGHTLLVFSIPGAPDRHQGQPGHAS